MDISFDAAVVEQLHEECDGFLPSVSRAMVAERLREMSRPRRVVRTLPRRRYEPEVTPEVRARVFAAYGPACVYCLREEMLEVDFLVPAVREGTARPLNLVVACERCRKSRGRKHLDLWFARRLDLDPDAIYQRIAVAAHALLHPERHHVRRAA